MWLAAKYGSTHKPPRAGLVPLKPQTSKDVDEYNTLKEQFPDVKAPSYDIYGQPDQTSHLELLRKTRDEQAAAIPDREELPRRVPGEDLAQSPPPPMRGRDLSQRVPGRDPSEVSYGPRIPSIPEWVQQMRDKGISLNHSLQRPDAARPEDMVRRPGGRDLMKEFTRPLRQEPEVPAPDPVDVRLLQNQKQDTSLERPRIFRRRRTSAVVNSYISDVLHKVSGLDEEMAKQGWDPYRSGGNRGYTQRLDDGDVHVLESQGDGTWIHNQGPSEDEMGDNPTAHDSLAEAMIKAHRGSQVQFAAKPPMSKREMN